MGCERGERESGCEKRVGVRGGRESGGERERESRCEKEGEREGC